ncbi:hypothetical protein C5167_038598 [Papaver somniferum]|uniref:Uncharacterized protein n=1 Tax=Papaver somniferum TaxID=3469 RepID=A0A4Y7IC90_PAPSO|nr:hypothetical protein C5167_038598 [Papaver somniferum]
MGNKLERVMVSQNMFTVEYCFIYCQLLQAAGDGDYLVIVIMYAAKRMVKNDGSEMMDWWRCVAAGMVL